MNNIYIVFGDSFFAFMVRLRIFTQCLCSVNDSMCSGFGPVLLCISVCLLWIKPEYVCFSILFWRRADEDRDYHSVCVVSCVYEVVFMVRVSVC